jgi:hypothetical protein
MLFLILSYLPSLLCGVHVVRSGREMYWLWIFVIAPVLGPAFYLFAVLIPEWMGGRMLSRIHGQDRPPRRHRYRHGRVRAPLAKNRRARCVAKAPSGAISRRRR